MTQYFPVVVEQESNGSFSAWVAGLPGVYAAADTAAAKRGIRGPQRPQADDHSVFAMALWPWSGVPGSVPGG